MSGLRLALISRRFWPLVDETETALAELAEEFQRRGHQVRLVTPQWQSHWPREMFYREVPILRLPHPTTPAWGTLRYRYALSQWLKSERDTLDAVLVSQHRHDAYSATGMLAGSRAAVVLQAEGSGAGGGLRLAQSSPLWPAHPPALPAGRRIHRHQSGRRARTARGCLPAAPHSHFGSGSCHSPSAQSCSAHCRPSGIGKRQL